MWALELWKFLQKVFNSLFFDHRNVFTTPSTVLNGFVSEECGQLVLY